MNASHDCPNCGANIRDDGVSDFIRCRFCGTNIAVPRVRRVSRSELETDRDQILARESEWVVRIREAGKRGVADFVVPPVGCCGIYFGLFVVGSLILTAIGAEVAKRYGTVVAAIAIGGAIIGVVLIIWRREVNLKQRVAALERERTADRHLREERLREIESELESF